MSSGEARVMMSCGVVSERITSMAVSESTFLMAVMAMMSSTGMLQMGTSLEMIP